MPASITSAQALRMLQQGTMHANHAAFQGPTTVTWSLLCSSTWRSTQTHCCDGPAHCNDTALSRHSNPAVCNVTATAAAACVYDNWKLQTVFATAQVATQTCNHATARILPICEHLAQQSKQAVATSSGNDNCIEPACSPDRPNCNLLHCPQQ